MVHIPLMAISAQRDEPFIFYVKSPVILRLIPLANIAILLSVAVYIPLTIGLTRFSSGFKNYPALWWLALGFVAAITFVSWLAFPSRGAQARLQIGHDNVSFIPSGLSPSHRYHAGMRLRTSEYFHWNGLAAFW